MMVKLILKPKALSIRAYLRPLAFAVTVALSSHAQAANYTVINDNDSGPGSLRHALLLADLNAGADTVDFSIPSGSTINLLSELVINSSVTIIGPTSGDANSIVLDAGGNSRHIKANSFPTNSGEVITVVNMTFRNGYFHSANADYFEEQGGSIFIRNANFNMYNCRVIENSTTGIYGRGGAIYVKGSTTITDSFISKNSTSADFGRGGALNIVGTLNLIRSTVSDNHTSGSQAFGGGIYAPGSVNIVESTISDNSTLGSEAHGGGIFIKGDANITQSTISNNAVTGSLSHGGGIDLNGGRGDLLLLQSTVTNNTSSTGAAGLSINLDHTSSISTIITNTILSGNAGPEGNFQDRATAPTDVVTVIQSFWGDPLNEVTDPISSPVFDASNDPKLGVLQHNGGLTQTHKPMFSSTAINAGSNNEALALNNDQRSLNFSRIVDGVVDIGAVEVQNISMNVQTPLNLEEFITRRDMARYFLEALNSNYMPPAATGKIFDDVNTGDVNADWIEAFHSMGYTEGCATDKFCPNNIVSREEMAKIYLTIFLGSYSPPAFQGVFDDLPSKFDFNVTWIEDLYNRGYTGGCAEAKSGGLLFCPKESVTREWLQSLLAN